MSSTSEFANKCEIKENELLGRFVVAAANIKAGETLLMEEPILVLPQIGDRRCSKCYNLTEALCSKCRLLPLCSDCAVHDSLDCERLGRLEIEGNTVSVESKKELQNGLKCLLMREHQETRAQYSEMLKLESHLEHRRGSDIWMRYENDILKPLHDAGVMRQLRDEDEINDELVQQLLGIWDVNAFEIRAPERGGFMRGLYMRGALFAHNCVPNVVLAVDEAYRLKVYANRYIAAGEILYLSYCSELLGTQERQHILKVGKYFTCNCARCQDPTELGTDMSSFVCSKCSTTTTGYIVQQSDTGIWQCQINPEHTLKSEFVANILERAKEEVFHARDDIYRCELLLVKLSRLFHGNHYVMLDLKQHIASILRQILQNMSQTPNRKVYERKIRLCQEILLVLKVIAPGISRLKAIALYELANTQAELARKLYSEKVHNTDELLYELEQTEVMLRESLRMLLYEPLNTPEGQLARNLLRELKELQNDMKLLKDSNSVVAK